MNRRKGKGANKYTAYTYVTDTHKRCSFCGEIKPHVDFHKDSKNIYGRGLAYYCKECANKKSREHHSIRVKTDALYKQNKKDSYIKARYGLSLQDYKDKLAQQETCAICGVKLSTDDPNTHLDHCHKTGKIRDFLCGNCNRGIGSFHDEIWKLEKAIQYLKSHNSNVDTVKEVLVNDNPH